MPLLRAFLTAAVAAIALGGSASAGDAGEAKARFEKELNSVYDYLPADVDQSVCKAKSKEMDRFWELVESDLDAYLPLLRDALRDKKSNSFFCFDGAGLLAKHAKDAADWQLAADATTRCRLKDVSDEGYFYCCHHLAKNGADVTAAALKMLEDPDFKLYLVQHAMWLKQADSVLLCLAQMSEDRWVPTLVKRLPAEKDATACGTISQCLGYASTPESDAALQAFATDAKIDLKLRVRAQGVIAAVKLSGAPVGSPTTERKQFEEMLTQFESGGRAKFSGLKGVSDAMKVEKDALHHVLAEDAPRIRAARRKVAARISDEGLEDLALLTSWLRRAVNLTK
jgi:hypothetical protein